MKKVIATVLTAVLAAGLMCGCGEQKRDSKPVEPVSNDNVVLDGEGGFGKVTVSGTKFVANGKEVYMNGVNTPWDNWNDFGGNFDESFWRDHFAELKDNGINSTRIWICCNGDVGVEIDENGFVSGATDAHWSNLDTLFEIADENEIYIMATLMSFDNFKDANQKYARYRAMATNTDAIDSYVENYVVPFCERYDSHDSLWSIDLCNEPDWVIENAECGKLAWKDMSNLFAREAAAIHLNSDILVTVGFGMIKYNSEEYNGNYASDEYLQSLYANGYAYLDFYSPHFYEWEATWFGYPFDKDPVSFGLDGSKPMMIGEFPATGTTDKTSGSINMDGNEIYKNCYANGWNGVMAWTSNGVDSCGKLSDFSEGAKYVAEQMSK